MSIFGADKEEFEIFRLRTEKNIETIWKKQQEDSEIFKKALIELENKISLSSDKSNELENMENEKNLLELENQITMIDGKFSELKNIVSSLVEIIDSKEEVEIKEEPEEEESISSKKKKLQKAMNNLSRDKSIEIEGRCGKCHYVRTMENPKKINLGRKGLFWEGTCPDCGNYIYKQFENA